MVDAARRARTPCLPVPFLLLHSTAPVQSDPVRANAWWARRHFCQRDLKAVKGRIDEGDVSRCRRCSNEGAASGTLALMGRDVLILTDRWLTLQTKLQGDATVQCLLFTGSQALPVLDDSLPQTGCTMYSLVTSWWTWTTHPRKHRHVRH